ncbi:MAG: hypothetical protein V1885_00485 [Candidatus Brennerbacteria bacterium]
MAVLPQNPEELLEVIKTPLSLLEKVGINIDLETTVAGIANQLPTDTSGVFPWLQALWEKAQGMVSGGDILGGLWELIKELLNVAVGLLGALVDLLRSLISSF